MRVDGGGDSFQGLTRDGLDNVKSIALAIYRLHYAAGGHLFIILGIPRYAPVSFKVPDWYGRLT